MNPSVVLFLLRFCFTCSVKVEDTTCSQKGSAHDSETSEPQTQQKVEDTIAPAIPSSSEAAEAPTTNSDETNDAFEELGGSDDNSQPYQWSADFYKKMHEPLQPAECPVQVDDKNQCPEKFPRWAEEIAKRYTEDCQKECQEEVDRRHCQKVCLDQWIFPKFWQDAGFVIWTKIFEGGEPTNGDAFNRLLHGDNVYGQAHGKCELHEGQQWPDDITLEMNEGFAPGFFKKGPRGLGQCQRLCNIHPKCTHYNFWDKRGCRIGWFPDELIGKVKLEDQVFPRRIASEVFAGKKCESLMRTA
jgi:hypothetical protein